MQQLTLKNLLGIFIAGSTLFMTACSKDADNSGKAHLQLSLTDDPGDFSAVYIDVQDVNINYTNSEEDGWQTLPGFKTGRYNLLTLVNDKDTVLADADIAAGTIKEIRLVLGNDNWVVTNAGDSVQLQTPSGQSSGIKLKINMAVEPDVSYKLLLDFDVAKSIHPAGKAGKYMLHPVIRAVLDAQGGTIRGAVTPFVLPTAIVALSGADTVASTYSGTTGAYMLKGMDAGTYSLHFIPTDSTLGTAVKDGITVETGKVTTVDTLTLLPE